MTTLNITSYSDADLVVTQAVPVSVGTNALKLHVRKNADDATVWLEATRDNSMLSANAVTDGTAITLRVPYSSFTRWPEAEFEHSLIMVGAAGERTELWRGTWEHFIGPTRWNDN